MRHLLVSLFAMSFLFSEEANPKNIFSNLIKPMTNTPANSEPVQTMESFKASDSSKSVIAIDAKKRADDFLKAYEIMRKDKPASRIFFKLANGKSISNIADLVVIENGTLLLFKTTSTQGLKYEIVPIEEIVQLSHL